MRMCSSPPVPTVHSMDSTLGEGIAEDLRACCVECEFDWMSGFGEELYHTAPNRHCTSIRKSIQHNVCDIDTRFAFNRSVSVLSDAHEIGD